jgi:hypothetical protein
MDERSNQKPKPIAWGYRLWSVFGCGTIGAVLSLVIADFGFRLDIAYWWRESLATGAFIGGVFGLLFPRIGGAISNIILIFTD